MFNGDRLNDDYDIHQRRFALLIKDELELQVADARVYHPRWYNGILAQVGDVMISAGNALKERNTRVKPNNLSVSMR
jgi:hypothetical protein